MQRELSNKMADRECRRFFAAQLLIGGLLTLFLT